MASDFISKTIYFFTDIYSKLIIKLVVGVIIILIGFIIGKILGRLVYKVLNGIRINEFFRKATGIKASPDMIISKAITYLIDFFVIIIALDAVAFTPSFIYVLSGALIVIIIFSIILGIKDLIPNIVAGLVIFRKGIFRHGDNIEINGHKGKIDKITLIETIIKKKNNDIIYIPNSAVLKTSIIKKSN